MSERSNTAFPAPLARALVGCLSMLLAPACEPVPATSVAIALAPAIPESVATISVSVLDVERNEIVTSATTAAPNASLALGVPAERLLEFRVIARTKRPGPVSVGAMPAFVGSTVQAIALGREQETVAVTVHPAGVLTLVTAFAPDFEGGSLKARIEPESSIGRPIALDLDPEEIEIARTFVLRVGRHRLVPTEAEVAGEGQEGAPLTPVIEGGRGLFVGRELESVARVRVTRRAPPLPAGAPAALRLTLLDERDRALPEPDVVAQRANGAPIRLRVEAIDAAGASLPSRAPLLVTFAPRPAALLEGRVAQEAGGLPVVLSGVFAVGTGRFKVGARAMLDDGRVIRGELAANVIPAGTRPGPVERLILEIEDPAKIAHGTSFTIDLVDSRQLFAQQEAGSLDLSASDPWIFFPDGPRAVISAADRGRIRRSIARPSGPRGLNVILRATLTSSLTGGVATSSMALPLLEID